MRGWPAPGEHPLTEGGVPGAPSRDGLDRVPRRAIAFVIGGLAVAATLGGWRWLRRPDARGFSSVAVLPFAVDVPQSAYVADGIVEHVIDGLTRIRQLRVAPRASAFRFKDAASDPAAAGRALDAKAVVTGRLTQTGDGFTLRVDLVDVARDAQVWSAVYEVALAALPTLESRVTHELAGVLRHSLGGAENAKPRPAPTSNAQAYEAYLQGRYLWNQRSEPSLQGAIVRFRRAIELDPGFALAHAALADAHTSLGYLGYVSPSATFPCRATARAESAGARSNACPSARRAGLHQVLLRLGLARGGRRVQPRDRAEPE
jgi:TolB-like protein